MASSLLQNVYNPDVLSCIANLSNDEVFTPPELANKMLDMLPQELFENPDTTFLDPCCKSGVFLREIAKRLIKGLAHQIPDLEKRIEHIFSKQLFGIAITELTSLLSRRSVYCSKFPSSEFSAYQFPEDKPQGNIIYQHIGHTWKDKKCIYCGASQSAYDRGAELEIHAYQFIHNLDINKVFNMRFDVIIGNPPYQLATGSETAQATPLYHKFVDVAIRLTPRYLCMIIPSRWYSGGMGLDTFREKMLNDRCIKVLVDFRKASDCFPSVNVGGGICYFLRDSSYCGDCKVVNIHDGIQTVSIRPLNEYKILVKYNKAISIIKKVQNSKEELLGTIVSSISPFAISTKDRGVEHKDAQHPIRLISSKGSSYISVHSVAKGQEFIDKYKVLLSQLIPGKAGEIGGDGKHPVFASTMTVVGKQTVCTHSYLTVGGYKSIDEANNLLTYLKTSFVRFLVYMCISSIHITKSSFLFVPLQDFSKPWTDEELYAKYGLTEEEISFIESMIRPME